MIEANKLVKNLDSELYDRLKDHVFEANGGHVRKKNGTSCGQIINDLLRSYFANECRDPYTTPAAAEHLRAMITEAIIVSRGNVSTYGEAVLTGEDVTRIVTKVLARAGKVHTETRRRYRQSLISGFLREDIELIDGMRIVEFRVEPELLSIYG